MCSMARRTWLISMLTTDWITSTWFAKFQVLLTAALSWSSASTFAASWSSRWCVLPAEARASLSTSRMRSSRIFICCWRSASCSAAAPRASSNFAQRSEAAALIAKSALLLLLPTAPNAAAQFTLGGGARAPSVAPSSSRTAVRSMSSPEDAPLPRLALAAGTSCVATSLFWTASASPARPCLKLSRSSCITGICKRTSRSSAAEASSAGKRLATSACISCKAMLAAASMPPPPPPPASVLSVASSLPL
mmetsp:Transcript_3585/g.10770  ORF Transcript_3585/g.10770 Transcript_3585/m.10770 type:complete len:249 (-) Transcript_3585:469-1215(-)